MRSSCFAAFPIFRRECGIVELTAVVSCAEKISDDNKRRFGDARFMHAFGQITDSAAHDSFLRPRGFVDDCQGVEAV